VQNAWRNWGIPIAIVLPIVAFVYIVVTVDRMLLTTR